MTDRRDFDGQSQLPDVIAALLALVLPAEQHELIPRLTGMVAECKVFPSTAASSGAN
jgi:hypothetical protein